MPGPTTSRPRAASTSRSDAVDEYGARTRPREPVEGRRLVSRATGSGDIDRVPIRRIPRQQVLGARGAHDDNPGELGRQDDAAVVHGSADRRIGRVVRTDLVRGRMVQVDAVVARGSDEQDPRCCAYLAAFEMAAMIPRCSALLRQLKSHGSAKKLMFTTSRC